MKRVFSIILIMIMCFSLTNCSSNLEDKVKLEFVDSTSYSKQYILTNTTNEKLYNISLIFEVSYLNHVDDDNIDDFGAKEYEYNYELSYLEPSEKRNIEITDDDVKEEIEEKVEKVNYICGIDFKEIKSNDYLKFQGELNGKTTMPFLSN